MWLFVETLPKETPLICEPWIEPCGSIQDRTKGQVNMMQTLAPIQNTDTLQLTNEDKLRIGVAWDALSPNSRRAYQLAWRQLDEFLSAKGEVLDNFTDTQLAADLSTLDSQGIALNILSVNLASKPLEKCQFYTFFGILIV